MNENPLASTPDDQPGEHTVRVQQLFVKHQTAIKAFILSLQPNFSEADDLVQETFLTVTRKAAEFRDGSNFLAWAFTIARFKLLEARRRCGKQPVALSDEVIELLATDVPEAGFFESRFTALRRCLERLAPRAQEIVRLRYHDEHGPEEIASRLDWTANAVNVALTRARISMRDCVEKNSKEAA